MYEVKLTKQRRRISTYRKENLWMNLRDDTVQAAQLKVQYCKVKP